MDRFVDSTSMSEDTGWKVETIISDGTIVESILDASRLVETITSFKLVSILRDVESKPLVITSSVPMKVVSMSSTFEEKTGRMVDMAAKVESISSFEVSINEEKTGSIVDTMVSKVDTIPSSDVSINVDSTLAIVERTLDESRSVETITSSVPRIESSTIVLDSTGTNVETK